MTRETPAERRMQAAQELIDNPLLQEIFETQRKSIFRDWQREKDAEARETLYRRIVALNNLETDLNVRARELIDVK